jgi:putative nucleotidyltransferase with HDIG domain
MKKIDINDLKIGDKVLKFDCSWLDTDFLKHKFVVKNQATIDKIKSNDIKYVYIEEVSVEEKKASKIILSPEPDAVEEAAEESAENMVDLGELDKVSDIYTESVKIVRNVMEDIRGGKMFNSEAVKHVASNIAELTRKNKSVLCSVTKLRHYDDYTFQHSMNVSIYAASLAAHLGMSQTQIESIANAGLIHDAGKMLVPTEVLNKPGKLTEEEFVIMRNHVQYGYDFLKKQNIPDEMLRLAYEHHERYDGSGYPNNLKDEDISIEGKIGAVVDIYDAITSDRVYHKGMEPPSALKLMFKWADSHINKKVFEFFIKNIGIYPVGSLVLMSSHELAVVGKTNLNKPTEPIVLVFMNKRGDRLPIKAIDLSKSAVNTHKIVAPVNPESVFIPDDIYKFIDQMNKIS